MTDGPWTRSSKARPHEAGGRSREWPRRGPGQALAQAFGRVLCRQQVQRASGSPAAQGRGQGQRMGAASDGEESSSGPGKAGEPPVADALGRGLRCGGLGRGSKTGPWDMWSGWGES